MLLKVCLFAHFVCFCNWRERSDKALNDAQHVIRQSNEDVVSNGVRDTALKCFHALQTHRLAHFLWEIGDIDFALYLQSRSSEVFQTDIHPAARFGRGIFLDHATGLVVGETTVVEDDVSLLQGVTLGGTGKDTADRHPKIRKGAMIGAGAKILGNIEIGENARIAAGSVVLRPVDRHATVAGIPARVIKSGPAADHSQQMDQCLLDLPLDSFSYSI